MNEFEAHMDLHRMAGHLIRRMQQRSSQVFKTRCQAAGYDLTSVQFAALDALHHHPGIGQAKLAELIAYDRATIGGVVERMEKKGLVRREVSARDRRARVLALTPRGTQVFHDMLPLVEDLQTDILAALTPEERQTYLDLSRKVLARAGD